MRFATRTFLWSFIPFAFLLGLSFWAIQSAVHSTVLDGLRASLRQTHQSIARLQSKTELQNSRFLAVVSENSTLKAGLQLLLAEKASAEARATVEDQLREISSTLKFDFLMVSNGDGAALAGVRRAGDEFSVVEVWRMRPPSQGLLTIGSATYHVTSVRVNQGDEQLGVLTLGEVFDFADLSTPAVLTHHDKVVRSSFNGVAPGEVQRALGNCKGMAECEVRLKGETFLSMPLESISFGDGYVLRSLQSVDSASEDVLAVLTKVFVATGTAALLAALMLSIVSSRSIVKPIDQLVRSLRQVEETGVLAAMSSSGVQIQEIRQLTESFNRAAGAIADARRKLYDAYVEFVESLANALDARDHYTAGHSTRVSAYSCAIATAMQMDPNALDEVRIGAMLHDIGKIGIADAVLQKPGKLTKEEFEIIKKHPLIGRDILQEVHGFRSYLPMVELHHENPDGTGYPWGLKGDDIPLCASIVHVADAYDAMTTDRTYRSGMPHERAAQILVQCSGTQFRPDVVDALLSLNDLPWKHLGNNRDRNQLSNLATALDAEQPTARVEKTS
jgi:HD-GYP domain-containing protein (c-di-GMP phosphodiesterase class II)